ncbi:hypothetical protein [Sphingomonas sp.]|uniref:hypothetical protein n=1 Tax=Sphingomonas sp. TaxID=28214 RepID=UPI003F71A9B2
MRKLVIPLACLTLASCSDGVDPSTWTCESLVGPVIAMSKDKDLRILEITNPSTRPGSSAEQITCDGQAEWSQGEGSITYGARVSDGGRVILEYQQD